jgi:radical SAM protein with 4Fe4S-binding SPASM domain
MWYAPTPYCIFNPIAEGLGNKSCAACDGLLSVAPDGSVLPCSSYNEAVGNLLETPFREIWNGKQACFFRKKDFLPEDCRDCEHMDICSGACPLYWNTEGLDELKLVSNKYSLSKRRDESCIEQGREV